MKCSTEAALDSLIFSVESSFPDWKVLFFTEADAVQSTSFEVKHERHRVYRHWPGEGSRSMCFVVHSSLSQVSCSSVSQNRVFGLELSSASVGRECSLSLVGVHGPHDALEMQDFLGDISHVAGQRRSKGELVFLGDWNVDMAPTFENCPRRSRKPLSDMSSRRDFLEAFSVSNSLDFFFPDHIDGMPVNERFHDLCMSFPFTRVPEGQQLGEPSLLDYVLGKPGSVRGCVGSWQEVPTDHCMVSVIVNFRTRVRKFCRTKWVLDDRDSAVCYALSNWPSWFEVGKFCERSTPANFCEFLRNVRDANCCKLTCRERRQQRLPFHLRLLMSRFKRAPPDQKLVLRAALWRARLLWFQELRLRRQRLAVDRGGVVCKSKRLFRIKSLRDSNSVQTADAEIVHSLGDHFSNTFGCNLTHLKEVALDFMRVCEGAPPPFDEVSVENVLVKSKRPLQLDAYGVCTELLRVAFEAKPDAFCAWIAKLVSSEELMKSLVCPFLCFGKESSSCSLQKVRAIMPPGALVKFLDGLLASALRDSLVSVLPKLPGCIVGAQRFTQAADIGQGVQLLIEKGLDLKSNAALAQGDIKRYFDHLPLVRICRFLAAKGVDKRLLSAIMRHQLLIRLKIERSGVVFFVGLRSTGGITGSTLALTLSRVPVESAFRELLPTCKLHGFKISADRLVFGSFVDNIYCASNNAQSAIEMLRIVFNHLKLVWGLDMKAGSASCLVARGHDVSDLEPLAEIPIVSSAVVLGWRISDDASFSAQWTLAKALAWGAFHSNVRCRGWKSFGVRRRLALLDRAVKPVLMHRLRIFGPTQFFFDKVGKLQRHLVSRACGNHRLSSDSARDFFSRVSRETRALIGTSVSDWALEWVKGTLAWDAHLARDNLEQERFYSAFQNQDSDRSSTGCEYYVSHEVVYVTSFSWAARLSRFMDKSFFDKVRATERRNIFWALLTRTNTRCIRSHVSVRWHDSVDFCTRVNAANGQ